MLIKCPECELQVSDKAYECPHCGLPMRQNASREKSRKQGTNKKRKLPNGFGQITKINGAKLRKPYRAMVTVGRDSKGRPIQKLLKPESYFKTYNEAYEALLEYNKNPYDLEPDMTLIQLYEKWIEHYAEHVKSESSVRTVKSAFSYCSTIYDMRVKDIRPRHIRGCMEEGYVERKGEKHYATPNIKSRIKTFFNVILDYAMEYDIVDKNYARTFDLDGSVYEEREEMKRGHIPFKDDEMDLLWQHVEDKKYVDVVLIQCFSGWRPGELGLIKLDDVDLEQGFFKGGIKTKAGKNRVVPIHSRIRPLVEKKYQEAIALGSEYLINCTDAQTHRGNYRFTYDKYQIRFRKLVEELNINPNHRAHDGRTHFITKAKKYGVDEYAIKYMVGHEISDVTEKVYTFRELEWFKEEIEKIK